MKKSLVLTLLFVFWLIGEACGQEKIRVGQGSVSLQSGLMHIGKDRGLFAKYGLAPEVIYIPGGSTNVHVLISGNLGSVATQRRARRGGQSGRRGYRLFRRSARQAELSTDYPARN